MKTNTFFNSSQEIKDFLLQRMNTLGINQNQLAKKMNKNAQEISYFFTKKKLVSFEDYLEYNGAIEGFAKKDLPVSMIQYNNDEAENNSQII